MRLANSKTRSQKRYDDTDLIVSEIIEHGYDSERGSRAITRMNAIHARFKIANNDFLYVLSTFVLEPIRWNARFGWRAMTEPERLGWFWFWREVGQRMGITELPETCEELERYNVAYERDAFRHAQLRIEIPRVDYPNGYRIESLGPPPFSDRDAEP